MDQETGDDDRTFTPLSWTECPQKSNTALHSIQEVKEMDMQIPPVIEGYYHNALHLVYYSYSNGQVWVENISQPSALIADWERENGHHWFKLHTWRGRTRARLLSPSGSSRNLNIKLSSSIFDVSAIAAERRIWDPLVLCYKMEIFQRAPNSPVLSTARAGESFQQREGRSYKKVH